MGLKDLRHIGLTEGEIKVYEALLHLGDCTKTQLAKQSGIAPSNIYDVANRLTKKGIISKVVKNGVTHFSPVNPKHIFDYLEAKQKGIEEEKQILSELLPQLVRSFEKSKEKVDVEIFQGWNGLKTVFGDLLEECGAGDKNYVFGASQGAEKENADKFFIKYSKLRADKGIITNIIFNESLKNDERIRFFLKSKTYNVRFLQQSTPTEIMLYKNRSCIIVLTKDPLVIRITSTEVTDSFKQYFDVMWKQAVK